MDDVSRSCEIIYILSVCHITEEDAINLILRSRLPIRSTFNDVLSVKVCHYRDLFREACLLVHAATSP